ncbi:hypothetical protein VOLCADRAFT_103001 [Volvox carteri f. nagariensis]|uniref:Uncharacterized protein n=1 Tax=Volvox carteri f. nagariensis TaxID=3068 RepID=D8TJ95_VOLCA|nr:uncharacterized protein VOLCADRAFT_103001 [Volvox carteri f. nagariensis]EFJ52336.1 hypothetical protein VOLCADRAFT_103001 [Volvox carteri f. nagariensis]|eukprot:XP_002946409.1 hypothetical protein VOLCADRAFT_103001 [Volvox carteri f. nagariensis]
MVVFEAHRTIQAMLKLRRAAVCAAHPLLHITGIDYSSSLFDLCGSSLGPHHRTEWLVMDARALALRGGIFDVVLDKGCLDALCAGYDQISLLRSWGREITCEEERRSQAARASVLQLLREVERCLLPGGRYICISYEGPSGRQQFFEGAVESAPLSLTLVRTFVEEKSHNYVYVFLKGPLPAAQLSPGSAPSSFLGEGPPASSGVIRTSMTFPAVCEHYGFEQHSIRMSVAWKVAGAPRRELRPVGSCGNSGPQGDADLPACVAILLALSCSFTLGALPSHPFCRSVSRRFGS